MTLNKKVLAAAIVGGLFATSANAAVDISVTPAAPVALASELVFNPTTGTEVTNAGGALDLLTSLNYAFSAGEVRYARIECSSNVRFASGSAVTYADGGGAAGTVALGAINGVGTNAISFSVTSNAAGVGDNVGDKFTVNGNRNLTSGAASTCTYGLYDQPSQAAAGGTTGRIATASGAYTTQQSGYVFTSDFGAAVTANVEANPAFTQFVAVAGQSTTTTARLSRLVFDARTGTQLDFDGADVNLADLFAPETNIRVVGDFTAARNDAGTYTGAALARVQLRENADCSGGATNASTLTENAATFLVGSTPNTNQYLCLTAEGTPAIPASGYEATLVAVEATPASYNVADTGPLPAGSVLRNGTELQAPLVQLPGAGWLSRMVLTNTGAADRPYTVSVQRESGAAGTTGNLTGVVPANGTVVVDLNTILTGFTAGAPRATLNVNVAGPSNQIQGLYQIVNADSSTISNHVMVRPGTN